MIITQPERVLLAKQVARFASHMRGKVLDVGSGRSNRYHALCTNATSFLTLDTDPRSQPDILGSAEAIPLDDESVDSILCTQVLEHVPHPHRVVQECFRVLKPGGAILLTVPQMNELHEVPNDFFRYTTFGLHTLFTEAGFTVEAIDQRGKYFAVRAQMRIRYWMDTWKPYDRKIANVALGLLTPIVTRIALWRDRRTKNPAAALHAIGWCVLARKPKHPSA